MSQYSAIIQQSSAERQFFEKHGYMIQFAKGVSNGTDTPTYNVVYKSGTLSPSTTINWQTIYGLNWSTTTTSSGVTVTNGGTWQQCALGESYDLTKDGDWVPSQNATDVSKNTFRIGTTNYPVSITVILGTLDPSSGIWTPVVLNVESLPKGDSMSLEPSESIKIWYQADTNTPVMISEMATDPQLFSLTNTPYYFSYDIVKHVWRTPQKTPFVFTPP